MLRLFLLTLLCGACVTVSTTTVQGAVLGASKSDFVFKDATGKVDSAPIIDSFRKDKIVAPFAKIDKHLDPKLRRAATIAAAV